jgi:hypothetical protein
MPCDFDELNGRMKQKCRALSTAPTRRVLLVSIPHQEMAFYCDDRLELRYPVSTSRRPPSNRENSLGTPTGLHAVVARVGKRAMSGMVFKGRQPTGKRYRDLPAEEQAGNLITSRILRLRGLEPGINQGPGIDSLDRYIYIHGTNHEERIGSPFSGGCIEMRNADVIELFERVELGDYVWIEGVR